MKDSSEYIFTNGLWALEHYEPIFNMFDISLHWYMPAVAMPYRK